MVSIVRNIMIRMIYLLLQLQNLLMKMVMISNQTAKQAGNNIILQYHRNGLPTGSLMGLWSQSNLIRVWETV